MQDGPNQEELRRYRARIEDRWPLQRALLGGARLADSRGAPPQRERGPEYVIVLVAEAFDGMPWLERVHQAASLWDGLEMGGPADVHCYTPPEFERRLSTLPAVRRVASEGMDLISGDLLAAATAGRTRDSSSRPPGWRDFEAGIS